MARTPAPSSVIEIGAQRIPVRPRLLEIYNVLKAASPKGVPYEDIVAQVWTSYPPANPEATVRQHIHLLRNALEGSGWRVETYAGASKAALIEGEEVQ